MFVEAVGESDDKPVAESAAGEGDVGVFSGEAVVGEGDGLLRGEPLGFVDGEGVSVVDPSGFGVGVGDVDSSPVAQPEAESMSVMTPRVPLRTPTLRSLRRVTTWSPMA